MERLDDHLLPNENRRSAVTTDYDQGMIAVVTSKKGEPTSIRGGKRNFKRCQEIQFVSKITANGGRWQKIRRSRFGKETRKEFSLGNRECAIAVIKWNAALVMVTGWIVNMGWIKNTTTKEEKHDLLRSNRNSLVGEVGELGEAMSSNRR